MQLTRASDYAIRVMIHLAGMPPATCASHGQLAAAVGCPPQFLSKVLQRLAHAGLVVSHRGNTGGFELVRERRHASMLEVIEAVEGPLQLNACLAPCPSCSRLRACPARPVWVKAQAALADILKAACIDELACRAADHPPATACPLVTEPLWN